MLKNLFRSVYEWTNVYLDYSVLPVEKKDVLRGKLDKMYEKAVGEPYEPSN